MHFIFTLDKSIVIVVENPFFAGRIDCSAYAFDHWHNLCELNINQVNINRYVRMNVAHQIWHDSIAIEKEWIPFG